MCGPVQVAEVNNAELKAEVERLRGLLSQKDELITGQQANVERLQKHSQSLEQQMQQGRTEVDILRQQLEEVGCTS